jgi:hypothetical protein
MKNDTRKAVIGLIGLIYLGAMLVLAFWVGLWVMDASETSTFLDIVLTALVSVAVAFYVIDKIKGLSRHHEVTVRSGFRTVTVKGYKNAEILATVISERLSGERAPE